MYKRSFLALVLAALLLLSGCSLAQPEAETQPRDRMVGVLVTTEYLDLFDVERYFEEHAAELLSGKEISAAEQKAYQNVLFAEKDASGRYIFPDVEGWLWLSTRESDEQGSYVKMQNDPAFDGALNAIRETDSGTGYEFEATLYALNSGSVVSFYLNPVYQTEDGAVYAAQGHGMSMGSAEGSNASMSQTLTQTLSQTKDGETKEYSFSGKLTMQLVGAPERVTLFWMDEADGVLRREEYAAGSLPAELHADGAAFLLAIETAQDGSQTRTLCAPEDTDDRLSTFAPGTGSILDRQYASITW